MQKILIIGGVAAGATAAARARRLDGQAEITVLEAGPDVSFANCGLPYYIGGDIDSRSKLILQSPESFKDQYNVTVHVETEAQGIDRQAQTVQALHKPSGEKRNYTYDKLILAQGGKPIQPPIPGADAAHVFTLWTLSDMDAIHEFIKSRSPKTAVVVGGGFIGLEMAEALTKRGLSVNVVERLPQVMPNLEGEIAGFIQEELTAYGVGLHTSRAVTSVGSSSVTLDDGQSVPADMVLMSVGVRPTLVLAQEAGLALGEKGGLLVDEYLKTSDDAIYAAGDMVEVEHKVDGAKVRIPLAGPANRQGRIAASNALGQSKSYGGSQGTSGVRVFKALAGSTGLSLKQARAAGIPADAVTIHKENHTSYYPGATPVTVNLVYNRESGVVLGGQTAGYNDAMRRLDVLATAIAGKMTLDDLSELDLAYAPPFGTPNDPVNMAAFVAENRRSGYSPSLTASELDDWAQGKDVLVLDIRDHFAYERAHVAASIHLPLNLLEKQMDRLPKDRPILVLGENGKKSHQALRRLVQAGFTDVTNASGGYDSLERHARALGFQSFDVEVPQAEAKSLESESDDQAAQEASEENTSPLAGSEPIILDVRTPGEFAGGAFPGAINLPLDELGYHMDELGAKDRDILVYCASGARSAYAQRMLAQAGYSNVENGGGLMEMMAYRR